MITTTKTSSENNKNTGVELGFGQDDSESDESFDAIEKAFIPKNRADIPDDVDDVDFLEDLDDVDVILQQQVNIEGWTRATC